MEIRKDFAERMAALAHELPKQAVGHLLKAILPRRPVATRAANPVPSGSLKTRMPSMEASASGLPSPIRMPGRAPKAFTPGGAKRTRAPRGYLTYEVTDMSGHRRFKAGTWRRARAEAAIKADPSNSLSAQRKLAELYPEYADRTIPWTRLVEDMIILVKR